MVADRPVSPFALEAFHLAPCILDASLHGTNLPSGEHPLQGGGIWMIEIRENGFLRKIPQVAAPQDRPGSRRPVPHQRAHQGGLPRTVTSHQTDLVTRLQAEGSPLQQDAGTYLDANVTNNEHERGKASQPDAQRGGDLPV